MNKNTQCKIIIPIYKTTFSETEKLSLFRSLEKLGHFPFVLIHPEGVEMSSFIEKYPNISAESFPKEYFDGIEGYNRLMLSSVFYERFLDTEYILICQLDVFVFRDEVDYWCSKGYDYIGAPWIATPRNAFIPRLNRFFGKLFRKENPRESLFYKVGNGGFSLRKTKSFYHISAKNEEFISSMLRAENKEIYATEDVFWSLKAPELDPSFNIPEYGEALGFAIDRKPDIALRINQGKLPFACHGFNKPKVKKFWEPIIKREMKKS